MKRVVVAAVALAVAGCSGQQAPKAAPGKPIPIGTGMTARVNANHPRPPCPSSIDGTSGATCYVYATVTFPPPTKLARSPTCEEFEAGGISGGPNGRAFAIANGVAPELIDQYCRFLSATGPSPNTPDDMAAAVDYAARVMSEARQAHSTTSSEGTTVPTEQSTTTPDSSTSTASRAQQPSSSPDLPRVLVLSAGKSEAVFEPRNFTAPPHYMASGARWRQWTGAQAVASATLTSVFQGTTTSQATTITYSAPSVRCGVYIFTRFRSTSGASAILVDDSGGCHFVIQS